MDTPSQSGHWMGCWDEGGCSEFREECESCPAVRQNTTRNPDQTRFMLTGLTRICVWFMCVCDCMYRLCVGQEIIRWCLNLSSNHLARTADQFPQISSGSSAVLVKGRNREWVGWLAVVLATCSWTREREKAKETEMYLHGWGGEKSQHGMLGPHPVDIGLNFIPASEEILSLPGCFIQN